MKFSIIIVTCNRHKELFKCLKSIESQDCPFPFEVIVIFNGDRTYLEKSSQIFNDFKFHFIHKTTSSNARNLAIAKSQGEYLFFLDDDCTLPQNYFSKIDFTKDWEVLGGPDQSSPQSTNFQRTTGKAFTSKLCMGATNKRHDISFPYSLKADESYLNICNLWIKAALFKVEKFKFYGHIFKNEQNLLLKQFQKVNKKIHYTPEIFVYHNRKSNIEILGASFIKNGECRVQTYSILPEKKDYIYLLPLLWFFSFLSLFLHPHISVVTVFALYSLIIFLQYVVKYRSINILYIFLHYFILSMYSIGLLKGIWRYFPDIYNNFRENKSFIKESKSK